MTNITANQFENGEITFTNSNFSINSDNINTVLINCQIFWQSAAQNFIYIEKNGVQQISSIRNITQNDFTFVLGVEQGDIINFYCYAENSNTLRSNENSYIQICVLG